MLRFPRSVSSMGWEHVVVALGWLYVVLAGGQVALATAVGEPLAEALIDFVLVGGPGIILLYVGHRLPKTELHPEAYPRIITWCLGGFGSLLAIVGLLILNPSVTVDHSALDARARHGNRCGRRPRHRNERSAGHHAGVRGRTAQPRADAVRDAHRRSDGRQRHPRPRRDAPVSDAVGRTRPRIRARRTRRAEREQEFQRQNDRLECFASVLAHELRNPLSIAQGYLPFAAEGDETAADEVVTALDRIEERINVLLVTARGADSTVERETVALSAVAADAWTKRTADAANSSSKPSEQSRPTRFTSDICSKTCSETPSSTATRR